jgi:hypothetical protein
MLSISSPNTHAFYQGVRDNMAYLWEEEYSHFDTIVAAICAYANKGEYKMAEIRTLSAELMMSHRKLGNTLFNREEARHFPENLSPDEIYAKATVKYHSAYNILRLLQEAL